MTMRNVVKSDAIQSFCVNFFVIWKSLVIFREPLAS